MQRDAGTVLRAGLRAMQPCAVIAPSRLAQTMIMSAVFLTVAGVAFACVRRASSASDRSFASRVGVLVGMLHVWLAKVRYLRRGRPISVTARVVINADFAKWVSLVSVIIAWVVIVSRRVRVVTRMNVRATSTCAIVAIRFTGRLYVRFATDVIGKSTASNA